MPSTPSTAIRPFCGGELEVPAVAPDPTARSGRIAARASHILTSRGFSQIEALVAGEMWRAFLDEGGYALAGVLAGEELAERLRLGIEVRHVIALERVIDGGLRLRERERALRRDQLRDLERRRHQLVGLEYVVDEPDPQGLIRIDDAPSEDQVLRNAEAADPRQPLRPTPAGEDAQVDLRLAELGGRGRVPQIARERELAAASERKAVDRGERDLRRDLEQLADLVPERSPLLRLLDR